MIQIDKNVFKLLNDAPTALNVKIFFYIALNLKNVLQNGIVVATLIRLVKCVCAVKDVLDSSELKKSKKISPESFSRLFFTPNQDMLSLYCV